jgi:hypothetical protein
MTAPEDTLIMEQKRNTNIDITQPQPAQRKAGGKKLLLIAILLSLGCLLVTDVYPETKSAQYQEYEVKAAFLYNFLKFIDWPEEKMSQNGKQIIIGIIGEDPFGPTLDIFKDKTVENRTLIVKRFEGLRQLKEMAEKDKQAGEKLKSLKTCHLLFICPSERKLVREIIDLVDKNGVLTVGDTEEIIKSGGIIGFTMEDNKIRFDINLTAAEKTGIKIRSQLLRLAKKVIKDESSATNTGENNAQQEKK